MGYRLTLGKISKKSKEKYDKYLSINDYIKDAGYFKFPNEYIELYELGKYIDNSKWSKEAFFKFDIVKSQEEEFWIIPKETLAKIIDETRLDVATYYKEINKAYNFLSTLDPNKELDNYENFEVIQAKEKINHLLHSKQTTWNAEFGLFPYYLDQPPEMCDGFLTPSWDKEYNIFNLVYIYKSFDWVNDYLILSGS